MKRINCIAERSQKASHNVNVCIQRKFEKAHASFYTRLFNIVYRQRFNVGTGTTRSWAQHHKKYE